MNNQSGAPYQNSMPYSGNTLGSGGLKGFFDKISPMTMKIISIVLVLLTLLTFFLPWMQFSEDVMDELDDYDINVGDLADEMLEDAPAAIKRETKDIFERIEDGKFSLTDLQFVLAKLGESVNEAKEDLNGQEIGEYQYYSDNSYTIESLNVMVDTFNAISTINVVYQIVFFTTLALGIISLVTYWLDKRYNGWGLAVGTAVLFIVSIAGVILANSALEEEIGIDEPILALGVGGFFAIILAVAACIAWNMYLKRMPAGGVGISAFKTAFAGRQSAHPQQPIYPNGGAYQPPMNNYAQSTSVQQPPVMASDNSTVNSAAYNTPINTDGVFCPMCGTKCSKGNMFCPKCGNPLPQ